MPASERRWRTWPTIVAAGVLVVTLLVLLNFVIPEKSDIRSPEKGQTKSTDERPRQAVKIAADQDAVPRVEYVQQIATKKPADADKVGEQNPSEKEKAAETEKVSEQIPSEKEKPAETEKVAELIPSETKKRGIGQKLLSRFRGLKPSPKRVICFLSGTVSSR